MKRHSMRLGLSLIIALVWSGSLKAQTTVRTIVVADPALAPADSVEAPIIVESPVIVDEAPARRGIRLGEWPWLNRRAAKQEKLNSHGYCCDSHIDNYGCQNWRTQWLFMFGSCRQFFGEGCEPAPLLRHGRGGLFGGQPGACADCPR